MNRGWMVQPPAAETLILPFDLLVYEVGDLLLWSPPIPGTVIVDRQYVDSTAWGTIAEEIGLDLTIRRDRERRYGFTVGIPDLALMRFHGWIPSGAAPADAVVAIGTALLGAGAAESG